MKILNTPCTEQWIGCHSCSLACARPVFKHLSWDTVVLPKCCCGGGVIWCRMNLREDSKLA